MRIHHLNCGTMRPYGGRLVSGTGPVLTTATRGPSGRTGRGG